METGDYFKNGASLQSLMSKGILLLVVAMMMACSRDSVPVPEPEPLTEEQGVYLNGNSQEFSLHLNANIPYTVQLPDWVQRVGSSGEMTSGEYSFTAGALVGDERRDSIIFHPVGQFSETYAVPIVQMQPNVASLNVMTYNIRLESSGDATNGWYYRRASAVKIIGLEDIDILGTQETEANQHNYLKNNLPAYEAFSIGEDGQVKGGPNTIFYRKDRFTVYNKGIFWLSQTPDVPSKGWDALYFRIALWIELEDKISGIRFLYVNTHVATWGKTIAQQNSIILLMNKIHELRGNMPVIFTGDLNMPPSNDYIKYITDVVNNPYPLVHTKTVADIATGFTGSYHAYSDTDPGPDGLIDYVIVDENAKVLLHQVLPPKLDGIFLSDHAPVTAKIILK
jgi:endonuclease/exonuclease/phosphatase family metal-dependent hydrolase